MKNLKMTKKQENKMNDYLTKSGMSFEDRVTYNPKCEYSMVSMMKNDSSSHIRCPYNTKMELQETLRGYVENFTDYSNLEIFTEETLNIKGKFMCEDGEERELTLRQYLFGNMYEKLAKNIVSGVTQLKDIKTFK